MIETKLVNLLNDQHKILEKEHTYAYDWWMNTVMDEKLYDLSQLFGVIMDSMEEEMFKVRV